ncbi:osteocalcin 2-like [Sitodiplosis mosellana]|uniref:osteocalcin 2-like n=1 Tax=Sitodiplosis mosellana TaxID=263140 RepID=UPI00244452E6|nr:osteocalcin 2-like [Sitodiplosis mosellana]
MDEVNIKYLSQFNPILIVPVLSAVVGAILVFVFGFKRPNEPRFQSSSSIDSLKKSKRKANTAKVSDNAVQSSKPQIVSSAKIGASKKATDAAAAVTSKKGPANEKSSNNNNNTSSSNNNISKKKTDEKKSENGSPTKKIANKKTGKESAIPMSKKSKANKNFSSDSNGYNEKPADFDDGGWFTVQSKSTKQKNKIDDSAGNQTENASPKVQGTKNNKSSKGAKAERKQSAAQTILTELKSASDDSVPEQPATEPKSNTANAVDAPTPTTTSTSPPEPTATAAADSEPSVVAVESNFEKQPLASVSLKAAELNTNDNAIAFDELGEWTDAKPDRKRGNKKKSRKD